MRAILLVSHGSRSPRTTEEIIRLLAQLKLKGVAAIYEFAFLEVADPNIPQGIDQCINKGASEITILLNFLNSGRHVNDDIPEIIREAQNKYPHIKFNISNPVGQHPKIIDLFIDLINQPCYPRDLWKHPA